MLRIVLKYLSLLNRVESLAIGWSPIIRITCLPILALLVATRGEGGGVPCLPPHHAMPPRGGGIHNMPRCTMDSQPLHTLINLKQSLPCSRWTYLLRCKILFGRLLWAHLGMAATTIGGGERVGTRLSVGDHHVDSYLD